ncbi:preprotein translocase subunit SecE [Candidatus Saccharibacteria bacterium]|nr:preprotein translocase subunit SecE [Candidatus Saccharibacteria bacterium]
MAKDKGTVVRRITAPSTESSAARTDEKVVEKVATKKGKRAAGKSAPFVLFRPIFAIGRYFRDSWRELRQVQWTNRRATWALTLAVLAFCAFFVALIILVDWLFNWVIQEVIL